MPNLFSSLSVPLHQEVSEVLAQGKHIRIERIVSHGSASPEGFWYDQEEHEFVLLVQGAARLRFDDSVVELLAGDWIDIRAHRRHRADWTTPEEETIWLAVFYRD